MALDNNVSPPPMRNGSTHGHVSKKCPECMAYMPLSAKVCPSCKLPIGEVNRHGMASRKTDWKAYAVAIASWAFFFFYIWWAFIRKR